MDSPSAPPAPDPYATAQAQSAFNTDAARLTAQLSRFNQVTPFGSLTWTHGSPTTGSTGSTSSAPTGSTGGGTPVLQQGADGVYTTPASYFDGSSIYGLDDGVHGGKTTGVTSGTTGGGTGGTQSGSSSGYNPDDQWTSTVTLDPRVQALVDSYLKTSQGLQGAIGNALGEVNNVFSKPIDYSALPAAGDAQSAINSVKGGYNDLSGALKTATGMVGQSAGLASQGMGLASQAASQWQNGMKPLSFDDVPAMWQPSDQTRQQVIDSLYGQYTRSLDPQFEQRKAALSSQLANRGIPEGSEAWQTAMNNFNQQENDAYNQARTSSITGATDQMSALFDQGLKARQQGVGEATTLWQAPQQQALNAMQFASGAGQNYGNMTSALGNLTNANTNQQNSIYSNANTAFNMQNTQRQNALTEEQQKRTLALQYLASLRNGSMPEMPQFQAPSGPTVQPSNYSGNVYNSYNGQMQQYQANAGSNNALLSMLGQLGSAYMMM